MSLQYIQYVFVCECGEFPSHSYLMRIVRVDYSSQPEVSDLEQQLVCVEEYVGRLQVSVQDVG